MSNQKKTGIDYVTEMIDNHIKSTAPPVFVLMKRERSMLAEIGKWAASFVIGIASAFLILLALYAITH